MSRLLKPHFSQTTREMGHPGFRTLQVVLADRSVRPTRFDLRGSSGFAVDLGPPPADADEQESPVAEEFGRLAFKGVADELEDPSDCEQRQRVKPQPMIEKSDEEDPNRNKNGRNAKGVAEAIDGMLVTARVSRDPLLIAISAQHADKMILRLEPVGHGMA